MTSSRRSPCNTPSRISALASPATPRSPMQSSAWKPPITYDGPDYTGLLVHLPGGGMTDNLERAARNLRSARKAQKSAMDAARVAALEALEQGLYGGPSCGDIGGRPYDCSEVGRQAVKFDSCHEEVSRKHQIQPCDLPAVALRVDPESGHSYPVCVRHTRKPMVPLVVLLSKPVTAASP